MIDWGTLAAIAEIVGAVGVIASLVYVARQISQNSQLIFQNTELAKAARFHESNSAYTQPFILIASDEGLAEIYRRGKEGDQLPRNEFERYAALLQIHFAWLEDKYHQGESGLDIEGFTGQDILELVAPFYSELLNSREAKVWWAKRAPTIYNPSFHASLTRTLAKQHGGLPLGKAIEANA